MSSSTTIFVNDKPGIVLMQVGNFYSLTIRYAGSEVKFFIDTLAEVEDLAAKINERIEAQKIAAKMIDAHLENAPASEVVDDLKRVTLNGIQPS